MTDRIDLSRLSEPFAAEDIEWRVAQAGTNSKGVWCKCLAYLTVRAIQSRLDDVCGVGNWRNEEPRIHAIGDKHVMVVVGISIRIAGEWVTKWDVAEPTNIEPAKGGFSGAMKRAGAQWGVGRYLYWLDEAFAETSETGGKGWNRSKMPKGEGFFFWKPPALPAWALPKEKEHEIRLTDLDILKKNWRLKFAPDTTNAADLREGFTRFVESVCGSFPLADYTCWTREALDRCASRIQNQSETSGVSSDVPFDK